jgi:hypothetical protein
VDAQDGRHVDRGLAGGQAERAVDPEHELGRLEPPPARRPQRRPGRRAAAGRQGEDRPPVVGPQRRRQLVGQADHDPAGRRVPQPPHDLALAAEGEHRRQLPFDGEPLRPGRQPPVEEREQQQSAVDRHQ